MYFIIGLIFSILFEVGLYFIMDETYINNMTTVIQISEEQIKDIKKDWFKPYVFIPSVVFFALVWPILALIMLLTIIGYIRKLG
jgi:hypothetical protein